MLLLVDHFFLIFTQYAFTPTRIVNIVIVRTTIFYNEW